MTYIQLPSVAIKTVAAVVDTGRLVVINRDPCPDEANVPLEGHVAFEIIDTGTDGVDQSATQIWIDGAPAFDGVIISRYDGPGAETTLTADTLRIVLSQIVPFPSQAVVEVRVVSHTVGGAFALDETYRFSAEDRTAPRALSAQAIGQKTVRIGFDEPVLIASPGGLAFEAVEAPAVPITPVSAISNGETVDVVLNTEMTPDVRYRLSIIGVTDLRGNPILAPYDTLVFTGYRPPRPAARHFDLWSMLPKHNRRIDDTGDLKRFIACLQEVTDLLLYEVDRFTDILDVERAAERFVDLILRDLGNPFAFDLDELDKRRLASVLVELYRQQGTGVGIKNAIRFFLGLEVEILPYTADTMRLGEARLDVDWILGPSERFARYAFDVRVDRVLTDEEREQVGAIVNWGKPAHTHFIEIKEPSAPPTLDNWVLGVSEIGSTSILHQ